MLFDNTDEIITGEELRSAAENRPLIDLTVTSSENSPCSSVPPNQTIDDSNTNTTTSTTTFVSFRPQRCQFLETNENITSNGSEFNNYNNQRRAKSFRHFPSTKICNNRRSTR